MPIINATENLIPQSFQNEIRDVALRLKKNNPKTVHLKGWRPLAMVRDLGAWHQVSWTRNFSLDFPSFWRKLPHFQDIFRNFWKKIRIVANKRRD